MISSRSCGSRPATWLISGVSGQVIKLNIIDFGSEILKMKNKSEEMPIYGYILDGGARKAFYGSSKRERILYESKSNQLSIDNVLQNDDLAFLIQYQSMKML